jgi:lipopolysaccharide transport system permease protein
MRLSKMELIWRQSVEFTHASLKSRYRKTFAGFLWVLLNPVIMFGVQSIVFKKFLRLALPDYYLFLVGGLIPWIFMSQSINMTASVLTSHGGLLKAFKIHPIVIVISSFLDSLINFLLSSIIMTIPIILLSDVGPQWGILLTPFALIPLIVGTFAMASFVGILNVFYRDTSFILGFVFSVLFFLTPIFYPIEYVPENFRWIIEFNPFYHFITPYRLALYQDFSVDWFLPWGKAMLWAIGLSLISIYFWRKKQNELFIYL